MNQAFTPLPAREQALIDKYNAAGPRYTSYPTAPQFADNFNLQDFLADQNASIDSIAPLSLYVHIPFCSDICYYCACNKMVTREAGTARRYLDHLRRDIDLQSQLFNPKRPVRQLHWGGGSPTYLDDAEMTELMHDLAKHFHLLDSGRREYSIEIDPRGVDTGRIALMRGLGFNRVSMGIQDFDPLVQKAINRVQPFSMVRSLVDAVRRHDFRSLSFDLIYGLPHQDLPTIKNSLQRVLDLRPDRIACYNYAHMPHRFSSQRAIDRLTLPSAAEKLDLQTCIADTLMSAGYVHIGLDHYVLPDDDLAIAQTEGRLQRNFQGYSVQMSEDLVGLGVSSISQIGDWYLQNERDLNHYYAALEENRLPASRGTHLSAEDRLRRELIMGLICNLQVDLTALQKHHGTEFSGHFSAEREALSDMQNDGLIELDASTLSVTERGRPFLRNICMLFDQYFVPVNPATDSPRYSATL